MPRYYAGTFERRHPMLARKFWHKSLTVEIISEACAGMGESDSSGFCLICGDGASSVEPDAENYQCESCGAEQVYGADVLLLAIF